MTTIIRTLLTLLALALVLVDENDNILGGANCPIYIGGTITIEEV